MIQPPVKGAITDTGSLYTGVVLNLKAGDVISLVVVGYPITYAKVYMRSFHGFFGAFLISAWHCTKSSLTTLISGTHFAFKVLSEWLGSCNF